MKAHKKRKSQLYLIPLLTLIFLGIVLVISLIQASQKQTSKSNAQVANNPDPTSSNGPTKAPGQLVSLDFTLPGIGTGSGNVAPLRPRRNVIVYMYKADVNSNDSSVKPLFTVKTNVDFDSDPNSPTYGKFINGAIDMGDKVPDGRYQIVFKTYQALPKLIKERERDVGGKVYEVNSSFQIKIILKNQKVIVGDIAPAPNGDNKIDINDYKAVVNCFGSNADTQSCKDKNIVDLDDNGLIDGRDLNIMSGSIKQLTDLGYPALVLTDPTPTDNPKLSPKPTLKPTPVIETVQENTNKGGSGSSGGVMFLLFLLLIVPILSIVLYKKNKKFKGLLNPILQKLPLFHTNPPEKSTESSPLTVDNKNVVIEKDCFVKIQTFDDVTKRTVLTLTDDNGPIIGYFSEPYVTEGFANVKGVLKKEGSKEFIEVSEINAIEQF